MTIDEFIKKLRTNAKDCKCRELDYYIECAEEYEQLAEWLEELKEYRKGFTEARNKDYETAYAKGFNDGCAKFSVGQDYNDGITDFANKIVEINLLNCFQLYVSDEIDLEELMILASEEIAEQLKGDKNV